MRSFYREVLKVPKGEALVYGMHLPHLEFYAKELPPRVEGRVLEVGAFTGALVGFLQRKRPDLEWHALDGVEEAVEVGAVGTALTDLRPGGVARFGAKRVDVVANRGFIPKGTPVRVVEVRGITVVVEPLEE